MIHKRFEQPFDDDGGFFLLVAAVQKVVVTEVTAAADGAGGEAREKTERANLVQPVAAVELHDRLSHDVLLLAPAAQLALAVTLLVLEATETTDPFVRQQI